MKKTPKSQKRCANGLFLFMLTSSTTLSFMIMSSVTMLVVLRIQPNHALAPFVVPRGAAMYQGRQHSWPLQRSFCHRSSFPASISSSSSSVLRFSMVVDRNDLTEMNNPSFDDNNKQWDLPLPSSSSSSSPSSSSNTAPLSLNRFNSMHEVNLALDQLAEACGQHGSPSSPSEIITRAAQAEELWNQLKQQHHQQTAAASTSATTAVSATTPSVLFKPDVVTFNTVLKAWSRTAQSLAEYKQQALLFGATQQQQQQLRNVAISSIPVYTARDAVERATMLLSQQEEVEENANLVRPDTTSYNILIDAWAKSRLDDAPQAAERLLQRLRQTRRDILPDSLTYNGLIDAWSYSGRPESLAKLEQLHEQMEELFAQYEQQQGPDYQSANTRIMSTRGHNNRRGEGLSSFSSSSFSLVVKPTIRTVNSILHAHAKRAQEYAVKDPVLARRAADDARALLNRMTQKFEQTQDVDFQPDVTSYTTVMDAYGRCATHGAILEAEALLQELKDLFQRTKAPRHEPNIRTYTTLISAWAKVNNADEAPQRAQALLEEIKHLKHHGTTNNNSSQQQQQQMYPNARTYLAVIQCWARSRDPTKAQRALQILLTMKDLYKTTQIPDVRPNLVTYNAAIDACAKCQGSTLQQTDALKIAFAILKAIQAEPDMQPNHVTFATLLKATAALLPAGEERNSVAQAVFSKSQKAGMVDYYTIANLRKAVDVYLLQSLLRDMEDRQGVIDYKKIPQAWCKNVLSLKQ